ncbi:hypothetical protein L4C34_12380 [Vibrio profundum]|uniref:hypothetical protein n=1 Tax=Vibrio profundum TaxID=2910247 RepID=UPI003D0EEB55
MYRLLSSQSIVDNVVVLLAPYLDNSGQGQSIHSLKKAYISFLTNLNHTVPNKLGQLFEFDVSFEKSIHNFFNYKDENIGAVVRNTRAPEHTMSDLHDPESRNKQLESAYEGFQSIDPVFHSLFGLIINKVLSTSNENDHATGSASNPKFLGIVTVSKDIVVTSQRGIREVLVHEFTHNAYLLDELRWGYFKDMAKVHSKENYIKSSLFSRMLPLPRTLHSLLVACEILLLRKSLNYHPEQFDGHPITETILEKAKVTNKLIIDNKRISKNFTPRAMQILSLCEETICSY